MADTPPSVAESLLAKARQEAQARLRLYIGAAPGVGKSYRMLEDAHELRRQGVDVVIGFIEPHGRADTLALIGDLEQVPLRELEYRGRHAPRDGRRGGEGAASAGGRRRRAGAHERAGLDAPEALRRRPRSAGRRHRRHLGRQHPAHRVAERRHRVDDRRARPRDDPRLGAEARRRGRQRRRLDRDASRPAAPGQDLRRAEDRAGPHQLLSQRQPDGASRARAAAAGHRSGRQGRMRIATARGSSGRSFPRR